MSIPKLRLILKRSLDQLMQYLIIYLQMTDDQVSLWLSDPNQFVEDEDEDTMSYSVRISAENLLLVSYNSLPLHTPMPSMPSHSLVSL
jgi:hypothetical protein